MEAIVRDLEWLAVDWDEGPVLASSRAGRHREAAASFPQLFDGVMLWRDDGSPTYHLASVVDDVDFGITHVLRGNDHRPNENLHRRLHEALGTEPPAYVHHGLMLGADGKKLSKRAEGATVAALRDVGMPAEAVRAYLHELGLPRHDVHYDLARIRRLAVEAIAAMPDIELAERVGVDVAVVPALRGARDLNEAREIARSVLDSDHGSVGEESRPTLERFRELRERSNGRLGYDDAKALLRELKAVGGDLRTLRVALTGRERGPELAAVLVALDRDETIRRIDAAL
jgi:glutamyl-tRNA synthetase